MGCCFVFLGLVALVPAIVTICILIFRRPNYEAVVPLPREPSPSGFPVVPLAPASPADGSPSPLASTAAAPDE